MARFVWPIVALSALAFTPHSWADEVAEGSIRDGAHLFTPDGIARAQKLIDAIRADYQIEVVVDTRAALPAEEQSTLGGLFGGRTKRYYRTIAENWAENKKHQGLYLLIGTQPRHVVVLAQPKFLGMTFGRNPQRKLRSFLEQNIAPPQLLSERGSSAQAVAGFGVRELPSGDDRALLEALTMLQDELRSQAGDPNAVPVVPVTVLMLGLLALWLVLTIVQRRFSANDPENHPSLPVEPALAAARLAGLFGTPAAYWLYDRLLTQNALPKVNS